MKKLLIDHQDISFEDITKAQEFTLEKSDEFREYINLSRQILDEKIAANEPIYGVNTGYGASGIHPISLEDAQKLQQSLYRFHGCGVGSLLSQEVARMVVVCRIISLSKGKSGVSYALLERLELLLQKNIIPVIPSQGSVGASGDLTPLSYVAAVIAGEREVYFEGEIHPTNEIYARLQIPPYTFKPKEALSIMNGTSVMSAIALCAVVKFENLFNGMLGFVGALYELMGCDTTPLEPFVHESKPFYGQKEVAKRLLVLLHDSKLTRCADQRAIEFATQESINIQDSYSIRCVPQILGVVLDTLRQAKEWIQIEINSVNDNPLIDTQTKRLYTSGNFYGGYIAAAMDNLKVGAANMADLLDKEFALLVDAKYNRGLGENLKLSDKTYHHGFKAMQITLSALSAEVLKGSQAASIFSRSTESNNQDKVSMGTTAAMDFYKMQEDLANMLSIAHLGAAQALDIKGLHLASPSLLQLYTKVREVSRPLLEDRRLDKDIVALKERLEQL